MSRDGSEPRPCELTLPDRKRERQRSRLPESKGGSTVALNSSRTMAPKGNRAKLKNQAGDKVRGDKKLPVASKGTTSLKADKGKGLKKSAKAKSPVALSAVAVT